VQFALSLGLCACISEDEYRVINIILIWSIIHMLLHREPVLDNTTKARFWCDFLGGQPPQEEVCEKRRFLPLFFFHTQYDLLLFLQYVLQKKKKSPLFFSWSISRESVEAEHYITQRTIPTKRKWKYSTRLAVVPIYMMQ